MSSLATIARPYSTASFDFSIEKKCTNEWQIMLQNISAIVTNPECQSIMSNPKLKQEQQYNFFGAFNILTSEYQSNFLRLLIQNKRIAVIPEIAAQFTDLKNKHDQRCESTITSCYELTQQQQQQIVANLTKKYGCTIVANFIVDEKLIGGLRIQVSNEITDYSISSMLKRLQYSLLNCEELIYAT